MIKICILFITAFACSSLRADDFPDVEYGPLCEALSQKISKTNGEERADLRASLASLYMKDQKEEEAFQLFLQALSDLPVKSYTPSTDELTAYHDALMLYLEQSMRSPQEVGVDLEKKVIPFLQNYPQSAELRFLLAASFANRRQYVDFFDNFYTAYKQSQTSFLAYRTLGILHIKLFEKARSLEEKENQRAELLKYLQLAIQQYDQDPMLYKLQIVFAVQKEKKQMIHQVLDTIVKKSVKIPRTDIPFYINEAMSQGEKESAKQFLDKVATYYQYSRIIEEARRELSR